MKNGAMPATSGLAMEAPLCLFWMGYGGRLVEEATAHIRREPAADAAVLLTEPTLEHFYQRYGWEHVARLRVTTGDSGQGRWPFAMMLFISAKIRAARERFADDPLVLPGDEW